MPINWSQVRDQLKRASQILPGQARSLEQYVALAHTTLLNLAPDQNFEDLINAYVEMQRMTVIACPIGEPLNQQYEPPSVLDSVTLVASDGSQLVPDLLSTERWLVINGAVVAWDVGNQQFGKIRKTVTTAVFTEANLGSETSWEEYAETLPLVRDTTERQLLGRVALEEKASGANTIIALLDGELTPFGGRARMVGAADLAYTASLQVYRDLTLAAIPYGGLVGSALATPLVRLLEILITGRENLKALYQNRCLPGVTDGHVMTRFLRPGCRSAVFRIAGRSGVDRLFANDLAIHAIYINTGTLGRPAILRLEIPAWIARNPALVAQLHGHLLQQCQVARLPFPHILTLADQACHITSSERRALQREIRATFTSAKQPTPSLSPKSLMKRITRQTGFQGGRSRW